MRRDGGTAWRIDDNVDGLLDGGDFLATCLPASSMALPASFATVSPSLPTASPTFPKLLADGRVRHLLRLGLDAVDDGFRRASDLLAGLIGELASLVDDLAGLLGDIAAILPAFLACLINELARLVDCLAVSLATSPAILLRLLAGLIDELASLVGDFAKVLRGLVHGLTASLPA